MALPDLQLRSLARRDGEAPERCALYDLLLRLLGLLGDVPQPRAVQRSRACGTEHRDADRDFPFGTEEISQSAKGRACWCPLRVPRLRFDPALFRGSDAGAAATRANLTLGRRRMAT